MNKIMPCCNNICSNTFKSRYDNIGTIKNKSSSDKTKTNKNNLYCASSLMIII